MASIFSPTTEPTVAAPTKDGRDTAHTPAEPTKLRAELVRRIFGNDDPERPFQVWAARDLSTGLDFSAKGNFGAWGEEGDGVVLAGAWVEDPRYGMQFAAISLVPDLPEPGSIAGLAAWLARCKGIGPATARAAAQTIGEGGIGALADDAAALKRAMDVVPHRFHAPLRAASERAREDRARQEVLAWCLGHGLGQVRAQGVWEAMGASAIERVTADPWRLADLDGFGFVLADGVAAALGVAPLAQSRLRAAVVHAVGAAAVEEGHVYLPGGEAVQRAEAVLRDIATKTGYGRGVDAAMPAGLGRALTAAVTRGAVVSEDGGRRIYLPALHWAETRVREWFGAAKAADGAGLCGEAEAERLAARPDVRGPIDDVQAAAVTQALCHRASVLTGGPGTGKTTVTRAILAAAQCSGVSEEECALAAPTGRAAKRLAEVTGLPAQTLHRLLEFHPAEGFRRNAACPLDGRLLIIDEASMIDLPLMAHLLAAVPPSMSVLFVGDADQLPPVGPGAPFHFLCQGGTLPVARLQRIYRTDAGGSIAQAAREINAGRAPVAAPGEDAYREAVFPRAPRSLPDAQREAFGRRVREQMAGRVVDEVRRLLAHGARPDDVQVLCPIRRGPLGVEALNDWLRDVLNPAGSRAEVFRGKSGREFRLGDRVMHGRNDYDKGVFNGEIGRVVAVNVEVRIPGQERDRDGFLVEYSDGEGVRNVPYWSGDCRDVSLAYASTVHKAQGGEYPHVVFALGWDAFKLLDRCLVYTAVSRARNTLTVVREAGALERAAANGAETRRNQRLEDR